MTGSSQRIGKESLGYGVIAGFIFAFAEIVASTWTGRPPLMPFRMFASIVLGPAALDAVTIGTAMLIGSGVHVLLSATFGSIYGVLIAGKSEETKRGVGPQTLLGILYGFALWFLNFQLIGRVACPWFLRAPQSLQAMLHAIFYGLPLALMYSAAERRVPPAHRPQTPLMP
jgi:hypothetical protein